MTVDNLEDDIFNQIDNVNKDLIDMTSSEV